MKTDISEKIEKILKECFWNDYKIEPRDVEKYLSEGNKEFSKFLVMRILSGSSFPSARLKSIFTIDQIREYLPENVSDKRIALKLKLVRSVLLREPIEGIRPWKI
ncbi:MAG TPA: hypothetical protein PK385_07985 [Spirochaetota bacterium]|nr:hypothetical protein [Spirochaetota bacterium]HOS32559.1 hypothetical protein [Spirochaetota bacterium]HOS55983.1 hypothetical protein [Spirochaetota bacterium]HPK61872.1 hypothetical protein [Spirochaetota bacterium]HQF76664.1 hypothetical protein [Spirochaetota bacterium]